MSKTDILLLGGETRVGRYCMRYLVTHGAENMCLVMAGEDIAILRQVRSKLGAWGKRMDVQLNSPELMHDAKVVLDASTMRLQSPLAPTSDARRELCFPDQTIEGLSDEVLAKLLAETAIFMLDRHDVEGTGSPLDVYGEPLRLQLQRAGLTL